MGRYNAGDTERLRSRVLSDPTLRPSARTRRRPVSESRRTRADVVATPPGSRSPWQVRRRSAISRMMRLRDARPSAPRGGRRQRRRAWNRARGFGPGPHCMHQILSPCGRGHVMVERTTRQCPVPRSSIQRLPHCTSTTSLVATRFQTFSIALNHFLSEKSCTFETTLENNETLDEGATDSSGTWGRH